MPQNKEQEQKHDFGYSRGSGKGPEDWGKLNPRWRICNDGAMQSPIDLNNRVAVRPELGPLLRSYKPAQAAVTNRGHDIMVKWKQDAGILSINGIEFRLIQCHWHSPSEHTFNGTSYDLELHMVHESTSGGIAVVAENYRYGEPDSFLAKGFQASARPIQAHNDRTVMFYEGDPQ
ncbi:hypothetical protein MRB53_008044 [Persea americana]|uniref:Uncharacterized protein n=1 Tax=Persea americana TaxID=3435 RepID=A0ACC2MLK3_PERAE|nr:hypothetical protein MRB53_008044 [Persea americana]